MAFVTANGVRLRYEVLGRGTPAIFIHGGFGGPQSTLVPGPKPVIAAVPREEIRMITYDRRCAGGSEYTLDWFALEDLAADARALLAELGIDRSIVIGSSMGGMVALQYALDYGDRVIALGLLNTGADLMSETEFGRRLSRIVERARSEGDRAAFDSLRETLRNPPEPPHDPNRREDVAARMQQGREAYLARLAETSDEDLCAYTAGAIRNYSAFLGYDLGPRLAELQMPAVIIHGTADTTVPFTHAEALRKAIPHAEFHAIPNAIHGILAYPDAQEALRSWLSRHSEPS